MTTTTTNYDTLQQPGCWSDNDDHNYNNDNYYNNNDTTAQI